MAAVPSASRFPRWLVRASIPIAAIALTSFFIFLGFPYDLLAKRISHEVEASTNMRLRIGELSPHLSLFGPGLAASDVLAGQEGQRTIVVDELIMRPAWSTAWFRGTPAIHIDLTSAAGTAAGVTTLGDTGGWTGTLASVDVSMMSIGIPDAFDLDGRLDATVDLRNAEPEAGGGLDGSVDFSLKEGSIQTPDLPMAIPFEQLGGRLDFGGEAFMRASDVKIDGPLVTGTIEGIVGNSPAPGQRPLAIDVIFEVSDPTLEPMLGSIGQRRPDGKSVVKVTGSLAQPVIR